MSTQTNPINPALQGVWCPACRTMIPQGEANARAHEQGRHHQNQLRILSAAGKGGLTAAGGGDTAGRTDPSAGSGGTTVGVFVGIRCEVCDITVTSATSLLQHREGRDHKNKEAMLALRSGTIVLPHSGGTTNVLQASATLELTADKSAGASHETAATSSVSLTTLPSFAEVIPQSTQIKCNICNVSVCGVIPWNAHVSGQSHRKKASVYHLAVQSGTTPRGNDEQPGAAAHQPQDPAARPTDPTAGHSTSGAALDDGVPKVHATAIQDRAGSTDPIGANASLTSANISASTTPPPSTPPPPSSADEISPATVHQLTSSPAVLPPFHFRCDICQVTISGEMNFEAHLAGAQHRRKQTQQVLANLPQPKARVAATPSASAAAAPQVLPPSTSQVPAHDAAQAPPPSTLPPQPAVALEADAAHLTTPPNPPPIVVAPAVTAPLPSSQTEVERAILQSDGAACPRVSSPAPGTEPLTATQPMDECSASPWDSPSAIAAATELNTSALFLSPEKGTIRESALEKPNRVSLRVFFLRMVNREELLHNRHPSFRSTATQTAFKESAPKMFLAAAHLAGTVYQSDLFVLQHIDSKHLKECQKAFSTTQSSGGAALGGEYTCRPSPRIPPNSQPWTHHFVGFRSSLLEFQYERMYMLSHAVVSKCAIDPVYRKALRTVSDNCDRAALWIMVLKHKPSAKLLVVGSIELPHAKDLALFRAACATEALDVIHGILSSPALQHAGFVMFGDLASSPLALPYQLFTGQTSSLTAQPSPSGDLAKSFPIVCSRHLDALPDDDSFHFSCSLLESCSSSALLTEQVTIFSVTFRVVSDMPGEFVAASAVVFGDGEADLVTFLGTTEVDVWLWDGSQWEKVALIGGGADAQSTSWSRRRPFPHNHTFHSDSRVGKFQWKSRIRRSGEEVAVAFEKLLAFEGCTSTALLHTSATSHRSASLLRSAYAEYTQWANSEPKAQQIPAHAVSEISSQVIKHVGNVLVATSGEHLNSESTQASVTQRRLLEKVAAFVSSEVQRAPFLFAPLMRLEKWLHCSDESPIARVAYRMKSWDGIGEPWFTVFQPYQGEGEATIDGFTPARSASQFASCFDRRRATERHHGFEWGTSDYIFYLAECMEVVSVAALAGFESISGFGLPSPGLPSTHLPLYADLKWTTQ